MLNRPGAFVISLDFELFWGVRDKKTLSSYGKNIIGVRRAIPRILDLFEKYEISATWATVGFLFCKSRDELFEVIPNYKPRYKKTAFSPYYDLNMIGDGEEDDPYHYALSLIELIRSYPGQEIGSHTFSHYYCLEEGQSIESFREDIKAAVRIARRRGIELRSMIFPRNQFSMEHLQVLKELGFRAYRGTPHHWAYLSVSENGQHPLRRFVRLLDAYLPISGANCYSWNELMDDSGLLNIRASRMLRPYSKALSILEPLRIRRIIRSLEVAAKKGEIYHLWWHPHNFGVNLDANLANLRKILVAFSRYREIYGMKSLSLGGLAEYYDSSASQ